MCTGAFSCHHFVLLAGRTGRRPESFKARSQCGALLIFALQWLKNFAFSCVIAHVGWNRLVKCENDNCASDLGSFDGRRKWEIRAIGPALNCEMITIGLKAKLLLSSPKSPGENRGSFGLKMWINASGKNFLTKSFLLRRSSLNSIMLLGIEYNKWAATSSASFRIGILHFIPSCLLSFV